MKILVIGLSSQTPPVLYGGIERITHNLCNSLMNRGFYVNLLAGKGSKIYSGKSLNYNQLTAQRTSLLKRF